MSAPSLKSLKRFFPLDQSRKLRALMDGSADPLEYPGVAAWVGQCFNPPRRCELVMAAVNEEIGGFGVEAIRGRFVDSFFQDIQAEYVNLGDTYDMTILRDNETGNYRLTSWGDWVEANDKRRELV